MATLALFSWPFLAMALFNKLGRIKGVIWGILIPALTLPERFEYDLPALPPYDKDMAIVVGLLLGMLVTRDRSDNPPIPEIGDQMAKKLFYGLAGLLVLSAFTTVFTNGGRLFFGPTILPGLGLRDLISMVFQNLVFLTLYFMAQRNLSTPEAHILLLKAFVVAGLVYTLPILLEVRMAPQLHRWTYGYFQHSWTQHIRGGNFRPIVFMPHGLWIGIFLVTAVMAAFVLLKNKVKAGDPRMQYFMVGLWLLGVLLISRNLGASAIALMFVPILWFLRYRAQILISIVIMTLFLIHPVLRQTETVTFQALSERFGQIAPARQQSLEYRLENEAAMLTRAADKLAFGWGLWGRWRVWDPVTGQDTTVVDGRWIIILGERGYLGYAAYFGLLTLPTFLLLRTARRRELTQATAGLGLIMAAVMIYQIPNDTIGPLVLIMAGALSGFVLYAARDPTTEAPPAPKRTAAQTARARYTRFPDGPPTQERDRGPSYLRAGSSSSFSRRLST